MQESNFLVRHGAVFVPVQPPQARQEQSIELDYVLPDYFPDFFRLLHCSAEHFITEQSLSDGTLQYSLKVILHVLYCGEQTGAVQAVTQQLTYHKQLALPAELANAEQTAVQISAETAYLNCRAVNPRRIDLRGAVTLHIGMSGCIRREILSGAEGLHIQCKSAPFQFVSEIIRSEKAFTLSEDIRLAETQPALLSVLRSSVALQVTETRPAAGKRIVKGEAAVTLLYSASSGMETLTAVLPFSQIAEQENISDETPVTVRAVLRDILLTPESENNGDIRLLHCDLQIALLCEGIRTTEAHLLTDVYSTVHPVTVQREELPLLSAPEPLHETLTLRTALTKPDTVLTKVYAAWAEPAEVQSEADSSGAVVLSGTLRCFVMAADEEERPLLLSQEEPFTWQLPNISAPALLPPVTVQNCSYTLTGSDSVSLQTELSLSGTILQRQTHTLLTELLADAEERLPAAEDYALRLYFAQPGESVWEIAKRYHTVPEAVEAENDLTDDTLRTAGMLLIPNVK